MTHESTASFRTVTSNDSRVVEALGTLGESCCAGPGGPEVFAHFRQITGDGFKSLQEGQRVEFKVTQGQKGPQAEDIRPL
ncbi:cold-shock protein [Endozoicomonas atrinae]|uniref:cold-shock protein n=1 Tax=Endozoicomonas atrinae TaxID=1333660 RepID=UPI0009F73B6C|nr:cold shock domain-containing protein [Endozoicomonas atrinae]